MLHRPRHADSGQYRHLFRLECRHPFQSRPATLVSPSLQSPLRRVSAKDSYQTYGKTPWDRFPQRGVADSPRMSAMAAILLKNSLERLWSSNYKNFGLLDRSRIDDRHLGKGSMTPRKAPELANPEFFNRISLLPPPKTIAPMAPDEVPHPHHNFRHAVSWARGSAGGPQ